MSVGESIAVTVSESYTSNPAAVERVDRADFARYAEQDAYMARPVSGSPVTTRGYPDNVPLRTKRVEHPFGTIKAWMGAAHLKMRTLKHVVTEMVLH